MAQNSPLYRGILKFLPLLFSIFLLVARPWTLETFEARSGGETFESLRLGFDFFVLLAFFLSLQILISSFRNFMQRSYRIDHEDNLRQRKILTQLGFIVKIARGTVLLAAIIAVFLYFDELRVVGKSMLASAGVLGIILGFAAQKTLGNLIAGFQIAFTQPLRLDDAVVIENEWGWIEEITLTYIVVRLWDMRRLVLPISWVLENPFQNWTRHSSKIVGSVMFFVDYRFPVEELRRELSQILAQSPHWDQDVENVQVVEHTEQTKQIRVLVSAKNSPTAWDLRCEVREKLGDFIAKKYPEYLPIIRIDTQR